MKDGRCMHLLRREELDRDSMFGDREGMTPIPSWMCGKTNSTEGPDGQMCNEPGKIWGCTSRRSCYEGDQVSTE
ncbi:MAG: hypothetical protein Q7T82_09050 [Armatimonadota bacterium]|nr:hypothetical protein [Armatimonadota bacterium]